MLLPKLEPCPILHSISDPQKGMHPRKGENDKFQPHTYLNTKAISPHRMTDYQLTCHSIGTNAMITADTMSEKGTVRMRAPK